MHTSSAARRRNASTELDEVSLRQQPLKQSRPTRSRLCLCKRQLVGVNPIRCRPAIRVLPFSAG